ncbi:2-hydroxyisoflavanone dehydratase [Bienertia sinuspersici]
MVVVDKIEEKERERGGGGIDPVTGVESKDVVISSDPEIQGRIFLPKIDSNVDDDDENNNPSLKSKSRQQQSQRKLPLLVHFHGGGFCTGSAFGPITKQSLTSLVSMAQVVAFTVEYRLAPEHLLPIAYEDSWVAFQWVASHSSSNGPEPWFNKYVDFDRGLFGWGKQWG